MPQAQLLSPHAPSSEQDTEAKPPWLWGRPSSAASPGAAQPSSETEEAAARGRATGVAHLALCGARAPPLICAINYYVIQLKIAETAASEAPQQCLCGVYHSHVARHPQWCKCRNG